MRILRLLLTCVVITVVTDAPLSGQIANTVPPSEVLARVGPKVVTAEEFLERLELMPWRDKEDVALHDSLKAEALRSLVAEKLLALEAEDRGVGTDPQTKALLGGVERMLTKDQLYTEEIVKKTTVADDEVQRGLSRYPWVLVVKGYAFPDKESASLFAQRCGEADNLDSAIAALRPMALQVTDTMKISYGDQYPSYEDAIYALHRPGLTDPAFSPTEGWAVFHVIDRLSNPVWARQTPTDVEIAVRKKARVRIELERALQYARSYIRNKPMQIDSTLFKLLADSVVTVVRDDSTGAADRLGNDVDLLREMFKDKLALPLAHGNGVTWTLEEILESLRYYPSQFPPRRTPRVIAYALNRFIMQAVEGEMLSSEGKRRGLDRSPAVRLQMGIWEDAVKGVQMGRSVVTSSMGPDAWVKPDDDSVASLKRMQIGNLLSTHIATLAKKYGVELFEKRLSDIPITRFSMVTKHYIGFGGVMLAVPMIIPDWGWISRMASPVVAP